MSYVIGIDLGGTQLRAALVDARGAILAHERLPSQAAEGPAAVVARMTGLIARVRAALPPDAPLLGVGVGAPGPLDPERGMVLEPPNLPGWHNVPLQAMLAAATDLPVALANDADAAALGEWRFGGGRGCRHLVYVTVSTGIGGGVITHGHLLRGRMGAAGELGFLVLDAERRLLWEELASGTALARAAAERMPAHPDSLLHQLATPATVSAADVAAAALRGDILGRALMDREADLLGMGFASLLHAFSPEKILVGGSVVVANPWLLDRARQAAYARAMAPLYREVPIELAALGDQAGVLGAAAVLLAAHEAP